MSEDQKKWISIMIVPEGGAGVKKWRISGRRFFYLKSAFIGACVFVCIGLASLVGLGFMYGQLKEYKQYNTQLLDAASKLNTIASRLERYEEREQKLRAIIGSDFQLPTAISADTINSETQLAETSGENTVDEFGQLIERQESRMRYVPSIWPVNAWQISKKFEITGNKRFDHLGIDILAPKKSNVFATADGTISFAGFDSRFGLLVIINHGTSGWITKYGHNETVLVKEGEFVVKGQRIAIFGGKDESSTGAHLHYEMLYNGKPVDPLDYLQEKPWMRIAQN
ncbi:MAG: M23 family metallopeptidase [Candidatus Latescibacteria bacterium]|nr:M23 family metallopeptidase [Candidatus Latescibacterota bacterium]